MTISLYHGVGSCAFAPLIALEAVGEDFELCMLDLGRGDQRDPRYLAINPHGRVPALAVNGTVLTETPMILAYLADRYPDCRLLPTDPLARAQVMALMGWIATTVHVALAQIRRPARFIDGEQGRPELAATGQVRFAAGLTELDSHCAPVGDGWLSGAGFGAADMYALVVRRWATGLAIALELYPAFDALTTRAMAQSAVQRALAREHSTRKYFDRLEESTDA